MAAESGDAAALDIFSQVGTALGRASASALNLVNMELILIGGGASPAFVYMEEAMRREIKARTFRIPAERVKLAQAALGKDAGMIGAARLALDEGST